MVTTKSCHVITLTNDSGCYGTLSRLNGSCYAIALTNGDYAGLSTATGLTNGRGYYVLVTSTSLLQVALIWTCSGSRSCSRNHFLHGGRPMGTMDLEVAVVFFTADRLTLIIQLGQQISVDENKRFVVVIFDFLKESFCPFD